MRPHRRLVLLLAVPLVLATACGDDDAPEATAPPAATGDSAVMIEDFEFKPSGFEVEAGTTVRWTNEDATPHTVTSDGDDSTLASAHISEGDTFEHTFEEAGEYAYHCEIHPSMTATVTVTG